MAAKIYDCIIIGGGPAGATASIYASRANMSTLCIAGDKVSGLMYATEVEDFPGFPQTMKGTELVRLFREQAKKFGAEIALESVEKVGFSKRPFEITTDEKRYLAKTVIIATGSVPKTLGIPSEKKFFGRGVSVCAVCDGFMFKGKPLAVVGGGDSAFKEALYLTNLGCNVTLIHRRDEFRAMPLLQKRVKENKCIKLMPNSVVDEILGDTVVTGIKIKNVKSGKTSEIKANALFVAIGHTPNTGFLKGHVELDKKGYITLKKDTETSVPGVFVAGDVQDFKYMQAVTAAATGCKAALDAYRFLIENK
ncbi:MAG: thioredoxin-disulfide reductase [archaeon]